MKKAKWLTFLKVIVIFSQKYERLIVLMHQKILVAPIYIYMYLIQ